MVVVSVKEYDKNSFYYLYDNSWAGAIDTLNTIRKFDLEKEFMEFLENEYQAYEEVEEAKLNDFIWFERDYIYNSLGLDENGKLK